MTSPIAVASVLAVVAHPDDDLLFLNPDLDNGIQAGVPTTVVFVTSGHALLSGEAAAQRVRNRQRGIQDAYRVSGGVADLPGQGEWDGRVVLLAERMVEEFRLRDRPNVRLFFMGLPDGGLTDIATGTTRWTVPAAGGLVTSPQTYDAERTVAVLRAAIARSRPSVLHVTELYADHRYDDLGSHPDHRVAAAFAVQAAAVHRDAAATWLPTLVEHRDYGIALHPVNLDTASRVRKRTLFVDQYMPWDPQAGENGWTARAYYRRPHGARWSAVDGTGVVHLFVVRDGRLLTWRGLGSSWAGPFEIGNDIHSVTAHTDLDGRVQVAAHTLGHDVHVRPAVEGDWLDLGTHNRGDDTRYFGTPVLASNADGRLQVFAVNAGGGLSTRWDSGDGSWADWLDLEGEDLQDPCTTVLGPSGRIEVAAATRSGLTIWWQTAPNAWFARGSLPALAPAGPASFAVNADGRLELHYREADTANVAVSWQDETDGPWGSAVGIGGHAGVGEPATATVGGRIASVTRNRGGGVSVTRQTAPDSGYGPWTDLGGHIVEYPTAVATPDGRLTIAAVHVDGTVRHRTRSPAGRWSGWTIIG